MGRCAALAGGPGGHSQPWGLSNWLLSSHVCLPRERCCLWGQREGSRAQQGMCGVEAGIVCCLGTCSAPPLRVSLGVPFRSDCLAQAGALGSELSQTLGSDQGRGHRGSPTTWSDKAGSSSPFKPPSPPWWVSSALTQEEHGSDLHIFGRRPCSFPQQALGAGSGRRPSTDGDG